MSGKISIRAVDEAAYRTLTAAGCDALSARLFAARGITRAEEADNGMGGLLHFSLLKNAAEAARRLADTVAAGGKIVVVGDYDADGATATAVAVKGLRSFGAQVDFLVPNRFGNGYGISPTLVDAAHAGGARLLLTVDNGIAAHAAVARAQALGVEIIVTDHHLAGDTLPECLIVNPNQPGCTFPAKSTAGVGVMFYVLTAVRSELKQRGFFAKRPLPNLADLLDWVALGTVADVVRLEHNNRILVAQGLSRIRAGKMSFGMHALFQIAGRDYRRAGVSELGFSIAPRINAAGRLDDMSIGIRCLLAEDYDEAVDLAEQLNTLNHARQSIEKNMMADALNLPQLQFDGAQHTISVFHDDWHQGVIGIVAGRLREKFHRPSIVFARNENGALQGSGRSIDKLHLRDALDLVDRKNPGMILRFGGHAMAAGLTIAAGAFADFQAAFENVAAELLCPEDFVREYNTDGSLDAADITLQTAHQIGSGIWGQGFTAPTFCDVFYVRAQKIVGNDHSKIVLHKEGKDFEAMIFRSTETLPSAIRAVYRPAVNVWRNQEYLQLYIEYWEAA